MNETTRPRFAPEQEVRFAVVMYGGVSLAIYINGVAQELFRLVQATAPAVPLPEAPDDQRAFHPDMGDAPHALSATAQIYRELGQRLGPDGRLAAPAADGADGEPPAVRTRFVVDILSGTSAGGINGVLLAKALASQSDFTRSRRIWLDVADVERLMGGEPDSLLDGRLLHAEARSILRELSEEAVIASDPFRPAYVEQLDLAVTATDLAGLPLPLRLGARRSVREREHRAVFEFSCGTAATTGEEHSELAPEHDGMLAFAARATSSFPFAFAPVSHTEHDDLRAGRWLRGFVRRGVRPGTPIWLADGGYLDNKPFSYATQALRRRRADVPVTRKLLYLEPRPDVEPPPAEAYHGIRPDVYENVGAALLLPRHEQIRRDLAEIAERNDRVARLRDIARSTLAALDDAGPPGEGWEQAEASHPLYESLRVRELLDRMALAVTALGGEAVDDAVETAVREVLRAWASEQPASAAERWLDALDVAYRARRLSFLHDCASEQMRAEGAPAERIAALRDLKIALNGAFDLLRRAQRAPFAIDLDRVFDGEDAAEQRAHFDAVRSAAVAVAAAAGARVADPGPAGDGAAPPVAAGGAAGDPAAPVAAAGAFAEALEAFLRIPLARFDAGVRSAFDAWSADPGTIAVLRARDAAFPRFDLLVLPLAYPDLGEVNPVETWRVSPTDAGGLLPPGTPKLAGSGLMNFRAFLHRPYRVNDLLWGRLDGAEVILDSVLPADVEEAERARLRTRLHAAILRETLADELQQPSGPQPRSELLDALAAELARRPQPASDEEVVAAFRAVWRAPQPLPHGEQLRLAGRLSRAARAVLVRNAARRPLLLRLVLRATAGVARPFELVSVAAGSVLGVPARVGSAVRGRVRWLRGKLPGGR